MKKAKLKNPLAEEWDMSEGMGILPTDIPLTQNIGCVGNSNKKPINEKSNSKNKS